MSPTCSYLERAQPMYCNHLDYRRGRDRALELSAPLKERPLQSFA